MDKRKIELNIDFLKIAVLIICLHLLISDNDQLKCITSRISG